MKGLLKIFEGISAGIVAAMTAVITALMCLVLFILWNGLWDNPQVERAARADYVELSKLEAAEARQATAEALLAASEDRNRQLQDQINGYEEAGLIFQKSNAVSAAAQRERENEIAEIEANRKGYVPDLDGLGILDRLRNR